MKQSDLTIVLFGGVTITRNDTIVSGFASRKAEALFVYLACNQRAIARDTLATLFWPENDQNRALANLSVALSSLRKQLDAYLITDRHTIAFDATAGVHVDVTDFQQALAFQTGQRRQGGRFGRIEAALLIKAIGLYKGDFLAGFNIRNAPDFEAWALLERERLRQLAITALSDLIDFHQQRGQFAEGIRNAQQLLSLDDLQEETHRQLMRLYVSDKQRPAALAQYEQCVRILDEELGVEPDEETTALYKQIVSETHTPGFHAPSPPAHNLPAAATRFIGRKSELTQIDTWLAQPTSRLLTIVGPGGIGKTRLGQEAARAHVGEFANGVWIISLVPVRDLNGVATAIAEAMNLSLSGRDNVPTQLRKQLQSLETCLVLDNLEHLITSDLRDFISQLIEAAPDLRIIATSRERLRLRAETVLELHGLPFPQIDRSATTSSQPLPQSAHVDLLNGFAAVELFTSCVQRTQPSSDLAAQAGDVVRLCQMVGGLPLALELAATWTRVLSVAEIVAEIGGSLDALTTTLHDVPERHRSLRAVIDSSWALLSSDEQAVFRKLSVFRGGFTRTAAQQVTGATLPTLMSLVDRSFLRYDNDHRFRRHPLLLQFAQEQLAQRPDEQAPLEAAHARFFAEFMQAHETILLEKEDPQTLAMLAADWDNIHSAWNWGLAHNAIALLDHLVAGIGRFFASRGRMLEAITLFETALQTSRNFPPSDLSEQLITKCQVELGYFLDLTGRLNEAKAILLEANERSQRSELTITRINCLRILGVVSDNQGDRELARRYLQEAHQLCQTGGTTAQLLPILNALGNVCVTDAEFEQARAYFEEAMAHAEALGNILRGAVLHSNIAIIANRQHNYAEAIQQWQRAERGFRALNHELGLANTMFNIAMAQHGLGQYDQALGNIQQSYAMLEKLGQKRGMAGGLGVMGMIYHKLGQRPAARRYLHDCLLLAQEIGADVTVIYGLAELAEVEISDTNLEQAVFLLSFIVQQAATDGTTRANAQTLLDELVVELPEEMVADAQSAAAKHTVASMVAHLVNLKSESGK